MDTFALTPHETVTVIRRSPAALDVEATLMPGAPPPQHLHPDQDERFAVRAGRLTVRLGDRERTLGPGEVLDVPRGTPHTMWNAGPEPARFAWRTAPAGRTEGWFRALDALQRSGRVDADGMPLLEELIPLLEGYADTFRVAAPAMQPA